MGTGAGPRLVREAALVVGAGSWHTLRPWELSGEEKDEAVT